MKTREKMIIAVDAGRSSIKSARLLKNGSVERNLFSSKFGHTNFNFLKTLTAISFDREKDIICKVDNSKIYMFGNTCDKLLPPEKIKSAGSDEVYLQYAVLYTLISVANFVEDYCAVTLAINLTYNNMNYTDEIKEKIKGRHKVTFYDTKENIIREKIFVVDKLAIYYQGWTSVMFKAINDDLEFDANYLRDGVIIDIGRRTTDVALVRKLETVKGRSYEVATENIFGIIKDKLYEQYKLIKETQDIETLVLEDEDVLTRDGKTVNVRNYLKEAIAIVSENIKNAVKEDFGFYTPSWVLLTGGGSFYFSGMFKNIYNNLCVLDEFLFSNVLGMLKMMKKFEN